MVPSFLPKPTFLFLSVELQSSFLSKAILSSICDTIDDAEETLICSPLSPGFKWMAVLLTRMSFKTLLDMVEEFLNSRRNMEERISRNIEVVIIYKRNLEGSTFFSDMVNYGGARPAKLWSNWFKNTANRSQKLLDSLNRNHFRTYFPEINNPRFLRKKKKENSLPSPYAWSPVSTLITCSNLQLQLIEWRTLRCTIPLEAQNPRGYLKESPRALSSKRIFTSSHTVRNNQKPHRV